jgi:hypothetical protein
VFKGGGTVGAEKFGDREHSIADLMLLLAAVGLALGTWSCLDASSVPVWKSYTGVVITWLLVLAALTRNLNWVLFTRLLTGGWLVAAPFLLGFGAVTPARWIYLAIGFAVMTLAVPGMVAPRVHSRSPATDWQHGTADECHGINDGTATVAVFSCVPDHL